MGSAGDKTPMFVLLKICPQAIGPADLHDPR
jgi:hypothetical protein